MKKMHKTISKIIEAYFEGLQFASRGELIRYARLTTLIKKDGKNEKLNHI